MNFEVTSKVPIATISLSSSTAFFDYVNLTIISGRNVLKKYNEEFENGLISPLWKQLTWSLNNKNFELTHIWFNHYGMNRTENRSLLKTLTGLS